MPKPTPGPPREAEAIVKEDYRHLRELDATGWHRELARLYASSIRLGGLGIADELPNVRLMEEDGDTVIVLPHVPTVRVITPQNSREPNGGLVLPLGGEYARLEPNGLLVLVVNPKAPDAVIISEVERALKEAREIHPPAVEKPGRAALNGRFDARTFAKWRQDKIVQMARLLAWRAGLAERNAKKYPERVIGSWLGFRSAKQTSEAKATLKKALANLPALTAQINEDRDGLRLGASLRFSNRSASYHYMRVSR